MPFLRRSPIHGAPIYRHTTGLGGFDESNPYNPEQVWRLHCRMEIMHNTGLRPHYHPFRKGPIHGYISARNPSS